MSLDYDVFVVDPKPIPSAVPGFGEAVGPATWPPSTSTLISDDDSALLIDCLITEPEARKLAAWIRSHDRDPGYVYITHPHADHFLGLPEILAAFPEARPVALAEAIPAMEEQISPGYMKVWGGFFPGQLTARPVAPKPLAGITIPVGSSAATVIPVGTTDTGHSSVVHVPSLSLVVSGDVLYNQTHMWLAGSTPDSRASWLRALDAVAALEAGTVIAGHRNPQAAADLALPAGQADWVRELAGTVLTLTSDPDLRIAARLDIGWSLLWSNRHADALDTLISVAAEASPRRLALAWDATGMAATVAHQTGLREACAKARAALDALDALGEPVPSADCPATRADENRIWITACTDPFGRRFETVPYLHRIAGGSLCDRGKVGGAAWILDETELAVGVLREALSQLRAPGVRGASGAVLSVLEWACIDSGRWDDALAAAREANDIAAAYKMETVAGSADLATATVLAMRGDHDRVAPLLARVLAAVDVAEYRGFAARIRHAAGLVALAQGNYVAAYAQLRQLFAADGTPLHHHFSYLTIADFAAAAARAERPLEARTLLEQALARLDPAPGPRLEQLAGRARGLLAEPAGAEPHFAAPLADPAGSTWPFERAQLQLDYGEWLRRQRRIRDAKPILEAALETFRRLGAAPWTRRAESERRACGMTAQILPVTPGLLDELTTQQREVAILAARGLTNGEIADRLFLSPRTVASHLYRTYPKLGIAGRHQLRDLIDRLRR